jgi:hypothetical protein
MHEYQQGFRRAVVGPQQMALQGDLVQLPRLSLLDYGMILESDQIGQALVVILGHGILQTWGGLLRIWAAVFARRAALDRAVFLSAREGRYNS